MDDGKKEGTNVGDGQAGIFDAGEEGWTSSRQGINCETAQRDREESGEETLGRQGFANEGAKGAVTDAEIIFS